MIKYRSEVIINRPPAAVFPFLAEPGRQGSWMDMASSASDGPPVLGPGQEYTTHVPKGPIAGSYRIRVTAFDQDRAMTLETIEGKVGWTGTFTFEPTADGGTRMVNEGAIMPRGVLRLVEPLFRGEVSKGEQAELEKLKALVEAG